MMTAEMTFYRATPMMFGVLFLSMGLPLVTPQAPNASPLAAPPVELPTAPPPLTAEVPDLPPDAPQVPVLPPAAAGVPVLPPVAEGVPVLPPGAAELPAPPPFGAEAPPPTPSATAPVPGLIQPQPQVLSMIDALRDAGQFGAMAGLLDGLQMRSLTPMTTWLVPNDLAFSGSNYPKNVTKFLDYHVIRELLPYSRLLTLSLGTRIPTFLGRETCVVTNNQQYNFSVDNAQVVVPDLYTDSTIAVHGINAVLDDARFNGLITPVSSPTMSPGSRTASPSDSVVSPLSPPSRQSGPSVTFPDMGHGSCLSKMPAFCMSIATALATILAAALL